MEYESVQKRAARTGQPPHMIRADAAAGRIPGAIRIGAARSPWALPVNADTPAPVGAGVSRTQTVSGPFDDLMSTGDTTDPIATARRVAQRVSVAHTRPAQALAETGTQHHTLTKGDNMTPDERAALYAEMDASPGDFTPNEWALRHALDAETARFEEFAAEGARDDA